MLNKIAGADEAGRGAVLGPLVVAAVAMEADGIGRLIELNVKDSKLLDRRSRMRLYSRILELGSCAVCIAEPRVIDAYVYEHALNILEARMFAHALSRLKPLLAYVDACDTRPERFSTMIARMLGNDTSMMISSAHKADRDNVLVAAASIVAKVARDSMLDEMRRRYGDFGSGYPSDGRTRRFIRHLLTNGIAHDYVVEYSMYEPTGILSKVDASYIMDDGPNHSNHAYGHGKDSADRLRFGFIRYSWKPVRALLANL